MNLKPFDALYKGKELINVEDRIEAAAKALHYTVNILDPSMGCSSNIDVNPSRLNVYVDANSRIYKFTVG